MPTFRFLVVFVLLATTVVFAPSPAGALPNGIDGCFFRDLNGSSSQGDEANSGASGEIAFTDPITVALTDTGTSSTTTVTTDAITGCFEFPSLTDGVNYQINVSYPSEYYSSPTGGDTDLTPGPPPVTAGDPFTASYNFVYSTGDDLSVTAGVSGLPELSLGYFVTPFGDEMIETGTGPFDTTDSCPVQEPGDDCGTYDDVVRTNDTVTVGYTITADNIPDGNINPLNDVILEQVITPNPGSVVEVPSLHASCETAGVSPPSNIAVDSVTGIITVTCNLGSKDNGTTIVPTYVRVDGQSLNESSFEIEARVYTADDRAQLYDDQTMLEAEEIFASSAPRFDITKGSDASNPHNRVIYYQTTERTNPVTGVVEYGVNYGWDISVIYDGGAKGQAQLADPITFSDVIPDEFSGWDIVACSDRPYGSSSNMPNDDRSEEDWGDRGTWTCVEDRANNEIDITVTDVDTDGNPIPTEGTNGNSLAAGPYYAFAGSVRIWYPLSDFYLQEDPDWEHGDPPITGDYPLSNVIANFDPVDQTDQSNYGDDIEPLANNDRALNVAIYERGGFSKHLGSYEWADDRIPDGVPVSDTSSYPCGIASIPTGSLMEGQTQACSQGDAPVQPGQKAHFWFWARNDGTFPWASDTVELCDAFDNSTMSLTTWTGGEPLYIRTGLPNNSFIVEYATAGFNDDVAANTWANQVSAVQTCTAPNNDWNTDPYSFDADPATSLGMVGMIRIRLDPTAVDEVLPSEYFQISFPVEILDEFNGGPRDGQEVPVGTILANNANRKFGSTPYSATHMEAETYENSPWGDRMLLNRHQVRVNKTTSIDPTSATDDDLVNVQGADTVVWWLQPAVTAVTTATATNVQVIDTLPAGITFNSLCQARQSYPDANVTLSSVTNNPNGTTTLLFDLGDRVTNVPIGPIPVCTKVDNFLEPGTDLINHVEIQSDGDVSPEATRSDDRTISVIAAGEFKLAKTVDAPLELQLDTQSYTIGWNNLSDDFDFAPPDVIDVWPYNGDAVNPLNQRTEFDSNYSGSYELTSWMPQPITNLADGSTQPTGGTWYYSADDPNTIPYDPEDPANELAAGTVNWCTQSDLTAGAAPCDFTFSDSSAVRFIQEDVLLSKSSVTASYTFQAGTVSSPNEPADRYVNRFAARTNSVDDLIRSNEVLIQVLSMNLGDLVFLDADVDGLFTSGVDQPIVGTPVELWKDDGTGTMVSVGATSTNGDGRYLFDDLLQGTYEVRIPDTELTGGTLDTWTQTVSPEPADDDVNEDGDHQASDSGLGYTTSGPITLEANTVVDPPLGLEPTGENLFNLGNPYTFDNLSNMSVDLGFRGEPDVEIIKEVCDSDLGSCDLTTTPLDPSDGWVETVTVAFTDDARWRITVINTGDEVLTDVAVDDDVENDCNRAVGAIPDLGIGESYSYICTTTNVVGDLLNTATVDAAGIGSGIEVTDDDSAAVETPPTDPDIEIIKYVNTDDAQTAPGLYIAPGSAVTFTYDVTTGSGTIPLSDVVVTDDNGTPTDLTDDVDATYLSGDTDDDDRLDLGETWRFEISGAVATTGQYANWATAVGQPVTPATDPVSDFDPAHYFGVDSGIKVTKRVNDADAQTAPGVYVADGDPVIFTYSVDNTGNVALDLTAFTDDAGTPADPGDDWTPTYLTGDDDDNGLLDVNETWTYERTGEIAEDGQYTNTVAVTADDPLDNELIDDDPANYFGASPSLAVEKATNYVDADVDPVLIELNGPVTWTYELTNTGNVSISNPRISDDNNTALDPADDFFATYVSGDLDDDGLLGTDEVWMFTASGTATEESYVNTATATGRGPERVDESGSPVPGEPVTDDDPSGYIASNPAIAILKETNGTDNPEAPGVFIPIDQPVTWTYTVTNPGNVPLADVSVTDDNATPADPTDDITPIYIDGDSNNDDLLDLDETWIFEATGTVVANDHHNTATVQGTPPETINPDGTITTPDPIDNNDDDHHYGSDPAITIVKAVNGDDANSAPGLLIGIGDPVSWTYTVTNTGNSPLIDIEVADDQGVTVTCPATFLAVGDEMVCTGEGQEAEAGQYTNIGTVEAVPAEPCDCPDQGGFEPITDPTTGNPVDPVTANDPANHYGTGSAIKIVKQVCDLADATSCDPEDSSHWVETATIARDGDAVWLITVTNIGNVDLIDVEVSDPIAPDCDRPVPTLAQGEIWSYSCTLSGLSGPTENIASVIGKPAEGDDPPVIDSDDATTIEPSELTLIKSVDKTVVSIGDRLTYTVTLSNSGGSTAADIEIVDTLPTGLSDVTLEGDQQATYDSNSHTITWTVSELAAGAEVSVVYVATVIEPGQLINTASVLGANAEANPEQVRSTTQTTVTSPPPLAFTGGNSHWLIGIAAILVALGALALTMVRRRYSL